MKVSVIIPLYNKAAYIQRALTSVFNQTFGDYEIIIIDDGSEDDSVEVVKRMMRRSIRLITQTNRGPGITRQTAMEMANGEYIAFLDADDEWMPQFLEKALLLLEEFPQAGAAGMGYMLVHNEQQIKQAKIKTLTPYPWRGLIPDFFIASMGLPPLTSSSTVIPKKVIGEIQPQAISARIGEDQYLWFQIAAKYQIAFDSTGSVYYHLDAADRSCNKYPILEELPFIGLLEKMLQQNQFAPFINPQSVRAFISRNRLQTANKILKRGEDRQVALDMMKKCPFRLKNIRFLWECHYHLLFWKTARRREL